VLLTRGEDRDAPLSAVLGARGAMVHELPCVRIEAIADPSTLASTVRGLGASDWLVVTSATGATAVLGAVAAGGIRAHIAAVGERTAEVMRHAGFSVWRPSRQDATALARELPPTTGSVLLARGDRARPELPSALRARGFTVREVVAYRTIPEADARRAVALLAPGAVDVVVFASPSALEGLLTAVARDAIARHAIVAIGPTTAAAVRARTGRDPLVAEEPSADAILRAITTIEVRDVARA
jgi:uroporphyrinogen-III synthase